MRDRRASGGAGWLVLGAVVLVLACEDPGAKPVTTVQATDSADQVLEGFSHWVTKDGIRRSEVQADTAYFYESSQVTQLRHVRVVFYDLNGKESSTLTAKAGTYRWQDGSMQANGKVVVISPDGRKLQTDTLKYDNATNTISTNTHFIMDRGTDHLEGESFRSDPDFKNVVTNKPVGRAGDGLLLPGQGDQSP
ncbi:MAG TPA: LPS export ABC transporter periplasmic protein LptC [Gemmatimonadales bacterium]|jgi:LPS export ABC transporter protein LptC|nr:LPS export ABC transporter periplasmic protein LptC [Gemmatimonadales bacterium]